MIHGEGEGEGNGGIMNKMGDREENTKGKMGREKGAVLISLCSLSCSPGGRQKMDGKKIGKNEPLLRPFPLGLGNGISLPSFSSSFPRLKVSYGVLLPPFKRK